MAPLRCWRNPSRGVFGGVGKRYCGVGEAAAVDGDAAADEILYGRNALVPPVDVQAGNDPVISKPERMKGLRWETAADDHGIVPAGREPAGELHAKVILVSEEIRRSVVADLLAEHSACRGRSPVQRVGPVLDPDPCLIQRIDRVGDIASGVDIGLAGAQRGVDEDAIVDGETGVLGQFGVGPGSYPDDDHVDGNLVTVFGDHRRDVPGAAELGHRRAESNINTMLTVHLSEEPINHLATRAQAKGGLQWGGLRLDEGELAAILPGCGRGLQPAPASTHDDDPIPAPDGLAQPLGVLNPAQVADPLPIGTGEIQPAR